MNSKQYGFNKNIDWAMEQTDESPVQMFNSNSSRARRTQIYNKSFNKNYSYRNGRQLPKFRSKRNSNNKFYCVISCNFALIRKILKSNKVFLTFLNHKGKNF